MIIDLEGASRTILIDEKTVGADDITFGHSNLSRIRSIHKKHIHKNADEIMFILKGRGITGVDDQEKVIKAGDTVWVPGQRCTGFTVPLMSPANLFLSILARHERVPVLK